ncbi:hypothetical protein DHEL01_v201313 [Diaporthe helianthi]|uniref:Uncharacterized protein n=1 Tax=Diaporthe helianthi TaxID=158607 RepID=A0A2P5ICR5_DIAHE|nr:hypothetical protein DHEL01_v201313 [Diaporthe helianthi]
MTRNPSTKHHLETSHSAGDDGITLGHNTVDLPALIDHHRDILFIKCSPLSGDDTQWTSAMPTAVTCLGRRHATRSLYLILAVVMYWLPFHESLGVDAGHSDDLDGIMRPDRGRSLFRPRQRSWAVRSWRYV